MGIPKVRSEKAPIPIVNGVKASPHPRLFPKGTPLAHRACARLPSPPSGGYRIVRVDHFDDDGRLVIDR
jgi:hypothetical protein